MIGFMNSTARGYHFRLRHSWRGVGGFSVVCFGVESGNQNLVIVLGKRMHEYASILSVSVADEC